MSFLDLGESGTHLPQLPLFFRRATQVDQMELDAALSQMYFLCANPSMVSKMSRARKATKNRFYRDDPAFLMIQLFFIAVWSIAVGCTAGFRIGSTVELLVWSVISYVAWCAIFTSLTWWIVNHWLLDSAYIAESRGDVEWRYSLDVHCNGYFFYFIFAKAISFVLLPLIFPYGAIFRFFGNFLLFVGISGYFYNVFLGYLELPMVHQQERLLYPIPLCVLWFLLATISSWHGVELNFGLLYR